VEWTIVVTASNGDADLAATFYDEVLDRTDFPTTLAFKKVVADTTAK